MPNVIGKLFAPRPIDAAPLPCWKRAFAGILRVPTPVMRTLWPLLVVYFLADIALELPALGVGILMRELKMTPAQIGAFYATTFMPWSFKACFGAISDALPILGFHRRPYIILANLANALLLIALVFYVRTVEALLLLSIIISTLQAVGSTCSDAIGVSIGNAFENGEIETEYDHLEEADKGLNVHPPTSVNENSEQNGTVPKTNCAATVQAACMLIRSLGSVLAALLSMPMLAWGTAWVPLFVGAAFAVAAAVFAIFLPMDERQSIRASSHSLISKIKQLGDCKQLRLVLKLGGLPMLFLFILRAAPSASISYTSFLLWEPSAPPAPAAITLTPSHSLIPEEIDALFGLFNSPTVVPTDVPAMDSSCPTGPDIPHWHLPNWQFSALTLSSLAGGVVGSVLYARTFAHRNVVFSFVACGVLSCIAGLTRLVVAWDACKTAPYILGFLPAGLFALIDSFFINIADRMAFLPGIVIAAICSPKGMEGIIFAGFNTVAHIGSLLSAAISTSIYAALRLGYPGPGSSASWKLLWVNVLIGSLFNVIPMILLPVMVPKALDHQADSITEGESVSLTEGESVACDEPAPP